MEQKIKESFFTKDPTFYRTLFPLLITVALQNIVAYSVNMADNIMLGSYSQNALSGAATVNQIFFMVQQITLGIGEGFVVLGAQYWGQGRMQPIRKLTGIALKLGLICGIITILICTFIPHLVISIFTNDPEIIAEGVAYLGIIKYTFLLFIITNVLMAALRCVETVKISFYISIVSLIVNVGINYVLIFGKLGAPAMGVAGAACATLIARCIELILVLGYVYGKKLALACGPRGMFGWSKSFVFRFVETSAPVIANEFMWGLGTTMYSLAYGRMGDDAVAAITIATTIQDIAVVLFQGLSAATAVILGHELGAGHIKQAEKYATQFFILQFLVTVTADILLVLGRWKIIGIYNITPQVAQDVNRCLLVFAVYMPAKMFNYVNVVGVLRSGGDTKMCLFLDTSGVWFLGVPLAFLGAFLWNLPIYGVYALVLTEEIYKAILGYLRYRQKKWLKNLAVQV